MITRPMISLPFLKYDQLWCNLISLCVGGGEFTCVIQSEII